MPHIHCTISYFMAFTHILLVLCKSDLFSIGKQEFNHEGTSDCVQCGYNNVSVGLTRLNRESWHTIHPPNPLNWLHNSNNNFTWILNHYKTASKTLHCTYITWDPCVRYSSLHVALSWYSETSDNGPSEIGTQYNKLLNKGHFSRSQTIGLPIVFEPPRRWQLLYKGWNTWIYIGPKMFFVQRFHKILMYMYYSNVYPFLSFLVVFIIIIWFISLADSTIIQLIIIYQTFLRERHGHAHLITLLSEVGGKLDPRRSITSRANTPHKSKQEPRLYQFGK